MPPLSPRPQLWRHTSGGIAGQRWLLEVESKAADRITLFERMHSLPPAGHWDWEPFATIDVGDELDHQDSGRVYRFGEGFDGDFEYVSFDDAALASMFRFRVYRWSARGRWLGVRLGSGVLSVVVYWILRILLFIYLVIGVPVALVLTPVTVFLNFCLHAHAARRLPQVWTDDNQDGTEQAVR